MNKETKIKKILCKGKVIELSENRTYIFCFRNINVKVLMELKKYLSDFKPDKSKIMIVNAIPDVYEIIEDDYMNPICHICGDKIYLVGGIFFKFLGYNFNCCNNCLTELKIKLNEINKQLDDRIIFVERYKAKEQLKKEGLI